MVGLNEQVQEFGRVELRVKQAETLRQEPIETQVGPLLRATLQDHCAKLHFLALADIEFEEFVAALLEIY
jgi:hypothetical protein